MKSKLAWWLFHKLLPNLDAHITGRIIEFHDALVERGQIAPIRPNSPTGGYTVDQGSSAGPSRH